MTQHRYRDLADWPLTVTALIFLAAYAWQVVGRIEGSGAFWLEAVMWATWGIFAVDYTINLWLADDRSSWFSGTCTNCLLWCCRSSGRCACSGW